jgi:hypothetical protein
VTANTTELRKKVGRHYAVVANTAAAQLQEELKAAAPIAGGRLRQSIRTHVERPSEAVFRVVAEDPVIQAATTNTGARPHVIRPRRPGGVLSFYSQRSGGRVFTRVVHHPGNVGTHWWDRVIARNESRWQRALRR